MSALDDFMSKDDNTSKEYEAALAELAQLRNKVDELDAVEYAAHMPDDYAFGLPSWICQHLYASYVLSSRQRADDRDS